MVAKVRGLRQSDRGEFDVGAMCWDRQLELVQAHVDEAVADGATVLVGGRRNPNLSGLYFEPTVLTNVTHQMRIMKEETFGPVAALFKFDTEDEAITAANDTIFGLAAYFFTKDTARLFRVSEALEYGMVIANTGAYSSEVGPFGGVKASGLGREGSKYGIDEFLEMKLMVIGGV